MRGGTWIQTAGALLLALAALAACAPPRSELPAPALSMAELLGGDDLGGFSRALTPRSFSFPDDHGPHPEFRTEWWYFTGNLASGERRFGYQLTFFRNGLAADPPPRQSAWAASEVYMAHFALTDPAGRTGFHSAERFARAAGGLAGARAEPFRVWLEDWQATELEGLGIGIPPLRLEAVGGSASIELELGPGKPPVFQGERGLSRKGAEPGNASYYYSLTRLPTRGRINVYGEVFAVDGLSWMDREWSTSVLEEGTVGWDWFSLQLDDGRELMLYRLRREDGSATTASAGSLVKVDGAKQAIAAGDFAIEELERWTSPGSGRTYPARWRLRVPALELELEVEPLVADQELRHSFVYWEGAARAEGVSGGEPTSGFGYVELTGY